MRELVDRVLHAADVLQLAARMAVHELQAVEHVLLAQDLDSSRISVMNRPNFDLSPADSRHLPEPSLASFTRTPMRGRTLYFSAMLQDQPAAR